MTDSGAGKDSDGSDWNSDYEGSVVSFTNESFLEPAHQSPLLPYSREDEYMDYNKSTPVLKHVKSSIAMSLISSPHTLHKETLEQVESMMENFKKV